jgi:hypothetical protein
MPLTGRRPLTAPERGRLLADCIPFLVVLALMIFLAIVWTDLTAALAGQRTPFVVGVVLGIFLLVTGSIAVNRLRDLLAGVAVVEQDHLKRLWRPRRGTPARDCYGSFEHLGTLRMSRSEYGRARTGFDLAQLHHAGGHAGGTVPVVFRVTYSPASKIAWSVVHV